MLHFMKVYFNIFFFFKNIIEKILAWLANLEKRYCIIDGWRLIVHFVIMSIHLKMTKAPLSAKVDTKHNAFYALIGKIRKTTTFKSVQYIW